MVRISYLATKRQMVIFPYGSYDLISPAGLIQKYSGVSMVGRFYEFGHTVWLILKMANPWPNIVYVKDENL